MYLRGRQFLLSHSGIQETVEEDYKSTSSVEAFVFCDALTPDCAENEVLSLELKTLSKLAERFLKDYLERAQAEDVSPDTLVKAFEYAHEQLLRYAKHRSRQIAVSAVAVLADRAQRTLYAACAGDAKLFRITSTEATLALDDPQNQMLQLRLSSNERFHRLANALGKDETVNVECCVWEDERGEQNYVGLSYGGQSVLSEDALHRLGLSPHDLQYGVAAALGQLPPQDNAIRLCTFTHSPKAGEAGHQAEGPFVRTDDTTQTTGSQSYAKLAIGAAVCAITLPLLTLKFTSDAPVAVADTATPRAKHQIASMSPDDLMLLQTEISEQASRIGELEANLAVRSDEVNTLRHRLTAAIEDGDEALLGEARRLLAERAEQMAGLETELDLEREELERQRSYVTCLECERDELLVKSRDASSRKLALADLEGQRQNLSKQYDAQERTIQDLKQEIATLRARGEAWQDREDLLSSYAEENATLLEKLVARDQEISRLKDDMEVNGGLETEVARRDKELSDLEQELQKTQRLLKAKEDNVSFLEQNLVLLDDMKRQLDEKEARLQRLANAHESVLRELSEAHEQISFLNDSVTIMSDLKKEVAEREQQVAWLKAEIARIDDERAKGLTEAKKAEYEATIAKLKKTVASLDEFIDIQSRSQEEEIEKLNAELAQLYDHCEKQSHSESQLNQVIAQREAELRQAEKRKAELSTELERAQTHIGDMQERLKKLDDMTKLAGKLQGQLENTEMELAAKDALELSNRDLQQKLEHLQAMHKVELADKDQELAQIDTVSEQLTDARTEHQKLREAYSALEATLQSKQTELAKIQMSLSEAKGAAEKRSTDYAALENTHTKTLAELNAAKARSEEQDRLIAHLRDLSTNSGTEREDLLSQLDNLSQQKGELEYKLRDTVNALDEARRNYALAQERVAASDQTPQIESLEQDLAALSDAYNEEMERNNGLSQRIETQTRQLERLQNLGAELDTLRGAFNEELQRSRDLILQAKQSKEALDDTQRQLRALQDVEERYVLLRDEHKRLETEAQRQKVDLAQTKDTLRTKQAYIEELEAQQVGMRERLQKQEQEIGSVSGHEAQLEDELNEVSTEYTRIRKLFEGTDARLRDTIARADKLEARLALALQEKDSLIERADQAASLAMALEELEKKYAAEHALRIQKEKRFAALAKKIQDQRTALESIEQSKQEAQAELERTRKAQSYAPPVSSRIPSPKDSIASADSLAIFDTKTHKVQSGDTLTGIALKYYGTTSRWSDIYEANRDKIVAGDQVRIGDTLFIPE
ncbi:MAG: LysM peptidoglycan-binding domain-containing protein [Chlamydiia bacterium]|nr:LysM peptidoglycan-binding domain-containing protein [Chlamydiia bacterium]